MSYFFEDLYETSLTKINGIKFTQREIDIIACLISARRSSAIAYLLSISPRTVTTHLRSIMHKVDCNTQDGIISFLERSTKLSPLRSYYEKLVIQANFDKSLKAIGNRLQEEVTGEFILQWEGEDLKKGLFKYLPKDFQKLGINLILSERLPKKPDNTKDSLVFYLSSKKNIPPDTFYKVISPCDPNNYYLLVFSLLKVTCPSLKIEEFQASFQKQLNAPENNTPGDSTNQEEKLRKSPFFFSLSQSLWRYGILSLGIFIIASSFLFSPYFVAKEKPPVQTWNLPLLIDHYTDRKILTDKVWKTFVDPTKKKTVSLIGLYGLGGVGKTTLASYLIRYPKIAYAFRGWFSAETKALLKADYLALGEAYGLFPKEVSDVVKIKLVKKWLEKQKNLLLVYDNAPDIETLREFIPDKGHILVTSRNYKLPNPIAVDVMEESESIKLLTKIIQNRLNNRDDLQILVRKLGNFPLALTQAGYYIHENELSLQDYLKLYEANQITLFTEDSLPPGDQHEPIYVTWDLNIEQIKSIPRGEHALSLLDFVAYCYPENIPKELLMQAGYGNSTNDQAIFLNKDLKVLKKYSLVKTSPGGITIHRLAQEWVRRKHSKVQKAHLLRKGLEAIKAIYLSENKTVEDIFLVRSLLAHIETLYSRMKNVIEEKDLVILNTILGEGNLSHGNYEKSKVYFKNALSLNEKFFGKNHINTARALKDLSWVIIYNGDYPRALKFLNTALQIVKKKFGSDHIETASILYLLSRVYLRLGDYDKAKKLAELNLAIKKKYYSIEHIEMGKTFRELGRIDLYLGNYKDAERLLEKALAIREKFYGVDNVEAAKVLHSLSCLYLQTGKYESAKNLSKKVLKIAEEYYGLHHIRLTNILNIVGISFCYLKDYNKSKNLLGEGLDIAEKVHGREHMLSKTILANLGNVMRVAHNLEESKKLLEEALEFFDNFYTSNTVNMAVVIANLGLLYGEMGDLEKKREYLKNALAIFKKNLCSEHVFLKITTEELENLGGPTPKEPVSLGYFIIN